MKKSVSFLFTISLILSTGIISHASENGVFNFSEQQSLEYSYIYNTNLETPINAPINNITNTPLNNSLSTSLNISTPNNTSVSNLNPYDRFIETPCNTPILSSSPSTSVLNSHVSVQTLMSSVFNNTNCSNTFYSPEITPANTNME